MTVSTRLISNPSGLLEIEDAWNTLVGKCSKNPFCLSGFILQFTEFYRSRSWTPLFLVISDDNAVIGIAPLLTKKRFGIRFVRFVGKFWFPPDFTLENQYRETCIAEILDFLFKTLQCQFVELTLSAESPNLRILKQKCKANRIYFSIRPAVGHSIIPTECTWNEFETLRGRNFRRRFKKIERHLNKAGSWKITRVDNRDKESDVYERILDVERKSWKQVWRTQRGMEIDPDLPMIWKGAQYTARTKPDFKWSVWFLELNDQTLAYTLVLQYKEVAFFMKSSYDRRYTRFSPGLHVLNVAVRELFNKRQVRNIDLLTVLPFHRNWTSTSVPRVRVMMSRKGVSTIMMRASPRFVEFLGMRTRTWREMILDVIK